MNCPTATMKDGSTTGTWAENTAGKIILPNCTANEMPYDEGIFEHEIKTCGECQALGLLAEQRSKEVRDSFLQNKIFEALDNGKDMRKELRKLGLLPKTQTRVELHGSNDSLTVRFQQGIQYHIAYQTIAQAD